jgi:Cytoplasmic tRNA 2-thiolation protein 2
LIVAWSGGIGSSAALSNIQRLLTLHQRQCYSFTFEVVHIDETHVLPLTDTERQQIRDQIKHAISSYGDIKFTTVPLANVFDIVSHEHKDNNAQERLQSLLASLSSPTDKDDMIALLRTKLLAHISQTKGADTIIMGDSAMRKAIQVIAHTSKGRGSSIPHMLRTVDSRFGVKFCQPFKSVIVKEVVFYARLKHLEYVTIPTFGTKRTTTDGGINALTENFVCLLQTKFADTAPKLVKTAAKLELVDQDEKGIAKPLCQLCSRPVCNDIDGAQQASALGNVFAIKGNDQSAVASDSAAFTGGADASDRIALLGEDNLCYACMCLLCQSHQSIPSEVVGNLPTYLFESKYANGDDDGDDGQRLEQTDEHTAVAGAVRIQTRSEMREQIQDFLLEDSHAKDDGDADQES